MSFVVILIGLGYAMLLLCLAMPALRYQPLAISEKKNLSAKPMGFSVIVVYRNEFLVLPALLESFKNQHYEKELLEFWLVNDGSTDGSQDLITNFAKENPGLHLKTIDRLPTSNSAKKDGIHQAVAQASFPHILLTDADCTLPQTWASSYNLHYQNYADSLLVAGPVAVTGNGFTAALQQLEMIALQTITLGAFAMRQPFMCNGANLSFSKEAFREVDGYLGNDHLSSGDDVFLLEKLAAENVIQCHYLKDPRAIVQTGSKSSVKELIQQRARWARKGTQTKSLLNKLVGFHVAAASLLFLLVPILWVLGLISVETSVSFYLLKFFADFVVLVIGNQFFDKKNWLSYFIPQYVLYPVLVIAIGLKSMGTLQWHERSIDQPAG